MADLDAANLGLDKIEADMSSKSGSANSSSVSDGSAEIPVLLPELSKNEKLNTSSEKSSNSPTRKRFEYRMDLIDILENSEFFIIKPYEWLPLFNTWQTAQENKSTLAKIRFGNKKVILIFAEEVNKIFLGFAKLKKIKDGGKEIMNYETDLGGGH